MTEYEFHFIVSRLLDNANDALIDCKKYNNEDFYIGKKLAYYEVLDTIKNELIVREINLSDYGLDLDIDKYL